MQLLLVDAVAGIVLLAVIAMLAVRGATERPPRLRALGWILVAVPLPLAVLLHLVGRLEGRIDQAAFLGGVVAFAVGAALVLGRGDDDDEWHESRDDSPPWWPEFEREFRAYARRAGRPRTFV